MKFIKSRFSSSENCKKRTCGVEQLSEKKKIASSTIYSYNIPFCLF